MSLTRYAALLGGRSVAALLTTTSGSHATVCTSACVHVLSAPAVALQSWSRCSSGHASWPYSCFSSSSGGCSNSTAGGSNSGGNEAVADKFGSMMEIMMQNPTVQQVLLSRMPPHMQRPEVLRAMMANPEVRRRIAQMAQQTGLDKMLSQLDPSQMAAGLSATKAAGLDPAAVMQRILQSPVLAERLRNPRVMQAVLEMTRLGPEALKQYEGDKDVLEAAMEAGTIIQQMQLEKEANSPACSASSNSSSSSSGSPGHTSSDSAAVEQQLGMKPDELMTRLLQRPDLLAKVQDPKVQAALMEVSQSPWKIVKYLFNKDVMMALKEMKDMLSTPRK